MRTWGICFASLRTKVTMKPDHFLSQYLNDEASNDHLAKLGSVSASIFEQDTKLTVFKVIASPDVTLKSS